MKSTILNTIAIALVTAASLLIGYQWGWNDHQAKILAEGAESESPLIVRATRLSQVQAILDSAPYSDDWGLVLQKSPSADQLVDEFRRIDKLRWAIVTVDTAAYGIFWKDAGMTRQDAKKRFQRLAKTVVQHAIALAPWPNHLDESIYGVLRDAYWEAARHGMPGVLEAVMLEAEMTPQDVGMTKAKMDLLPERYFQQEVAEIRAAEDGGWLFYGGDRDNWDAMSNVVWQAREDWNLTDQQLRLRKVESDSVNARLAIRAQRQ